MHPIIATLPVILPNNVGYLFKLPIRKKYMEKLRIVADMAGDIFHTGHINLFINARKYFSPLPIKIIVALHTDEQIEEYKKKPVMKFADRKEILLSCRYVDEVIQAPDKFDLAFIQQFDYLVHGDDILTWEQELVDKFYLVANQQNKLVLLPYTNGISSSSLKNSIGQHVW